MEPHRLALPAGFRIENYEIQAVLGKGGFGITYVAYDWSLGRHIAIKELLPDSIATRIDGTTVVAMGPSQEESWEWARERFIVAETLIKNLGGSIRILRVLPGFQPGNSSLPRTLGNPENVQPQIDKLPAGIQNAQIPEARTTGWISDLKLTTAA